ncbi:NYN domain-containing protein [Corynebacterium sp. H78]|uniref:NYN domain-containing protein n=1 Tax=Corynebacterium sp. H78 TaxID=3133417 RepID=UPI0030B7B888
MLERTLVFVDTSYLLASFYNSWETGARGQLEIDLRDVVSVLDRMISQQLDQPVQRQLWYDGIPESGPHRYQRSLRTIDGVQLRAGQLIEWGDRRTQKAVDTRLVADMVIAAIRGQASDIVLVSGDADMLPGVNEASNAGVRVHLYGFGWDSMSSALRHACDSTTILDPREDFADSMQINVLEGPIPPVIRDKPLGDIEPEEEAGPTVVPDTRIPEPSAVEKSSETTPDDDCCPGATPYAKAEVPKVREVEAAAKVGAREIPVQAEHTAAESAKVVEEQAPQSDVTTPTAEVAKEEVVAEGESVAKPEPTPSPAKPGPRPNPSMMAPRRKLRSRYVPLPNEVWASAGFQTPFDVGQQYANWWYENVASEQARDEAHLLSGGGLPPEIDRPLLQFACETLHEYTLTENQRVNLRDGFHAGIRGVLLSRKQQAEKEGRGES